MSSLHKAPYGFLGALALKALGRTPDQVSDELRPVLELADFYLADSLDVVPASFTITAPSTSGVTSLPVPQGRAYRLLAYSIEATFASGDNGITSRAYIAINQGGGVGGTVYLQPSSMSGPGQIAGVRVYAGLGDRILLPASFGISGGLVVASAPGTPIPVNVSLLVHNFEN